LVDGGARFCSAGDCYCSNPDACFSEATASTCCTVAVTCEGSQNPVATIFHPGDGETRTAGSPIPFSGQANDPQDGALTGSSLVWTSDLTGALGTGETFNASLTAGTHRITLTATDSDANTGTDSIELIVQ
jgi:chitinase